MEDPDLIATLIPTDRCGAATDAFRLPHNRLRYVPPTTVRHAHEFLSREHTTSNRLLSRDDSPYSSAHRLVLRFSDVLKNPAEGITFGTNPDTCDILLAHRGLSHVSGYHFSIAFDAAANLKLKDCSTSGTAVSFNGQCKEEVRRNFVWKLDHKMDHRKCDVQVHVGSLWFKIEPATHVTCKQEFCKNVSIFSEYSKTALPLSGALDVKNQIMPGQALTPSQRPVYVKNTHLGGGSYGDVYKVFNASTGSVYAGKYFRRLNMPKDKWLKSIRREINIMTTISHHHIVRAIDWAETPAEILVMEYLPLGTLEQQHAETPITTRETKLLLEQCLDAVAYLHSHSDNKKGIVHRDIKPSNILVAQREPFLFVKLADFGFAKDGTELISQCGTFTYAAPEIFSDDIYTTAVDVWSLGVVVLQYAYGLPELGSQRYRRMFAKVPLLSWCEQLLQTVNDGFSFPLKHFLSTYMLRQAAGERLSAYECLTEARRIGLFDSVVSSEDNGTITPRAKGRSTATDDGGPSTVVLNSSRASLGICNDDVFLSGSASTVSSKRRRSFDSNSEDASTDEGRSVRRPRLDSGSHCTHASERSHNRK